MIRKEHFEKGGRGGGLKKGGGLRYHGDGNTRLFSAAAGLCNRAVTMTICWRGRVEGGRGKACV